jgi:FkbM family methyltransferase
MVIKLYICSVPVDSFDLIVVEDGGAASSSTSKTICIGDPDIESLIVQREKDNVLLVGNSVAKRIFGVDFEATETPRHIASLIYYRGLDRPIFINANTKHQSTWFDAPHEPETFNIFKRFLKRDAPYLDIGVCYGQTVLYGAQFAQHVYGLEPDPHAYRDTELNLSLNSKFSSKVTLFPYALGDEDKTAKFGSKSGNWGNSKSTLLVKDKMSLIDVEQRTFKTFATENPGVRNVNFIKMDVEGGEKLIIPSLVDYYLGVPEEDRPVLYLSLHTKWGLITVEETREILDQLQRIYRYIYHRDLDHTVKEREILQTNMEQLVFTNRRL